MLATSIFAEKLEAIINKRFLLSFVQLNKPNLNPLPIIKRDFIDFGSSIAEWLAYLLPDPSALGSIPNVPKRIQRKTNVGVAEVYQWHWLEERLKTGNPWKEKDFDGAGGELLGEGEGHGEW